MPLSPQFNLLEPEVIWKLSLLVKVRGLIDNAVYDSLEKCGAMQIYRTCSDCRDWQAFDYHCNLKFCPLCNWKIARKRAEVIRHWTMLIKQPKHIVLTARNSASITRQTIRSFQQAFGKLRRLALWKSVKGGCVSIEITNEGRGWHLHAHVLVDAFWVCAKTLALEWGRLVGQDFAIVKVMDVREKTYLNEVTKYVVKGAQLVSWKPEEIAAFIGAIKGIRFFAPFGSLYKLQRQIKSEIALLRPPAEPCKCGCESWLWSSEESEAYREGMRKLDADRGRGKSATTQCKRQALNGGGQSGADDYDKGDTATRRLQRRLMQGKT